MSQEVPPVYTESDEESRCPLDEGEIYVNLCFSKFEFLRHGEETGFRPRFVERLYQVVKDDVEVEDYCCNCLTGNGERLYNILSRDVNNKLKLNEFNFLKRKMAHSKNVKTTLMLGYPHEEGLEGDFEFEAESDLIVIMGMETYQYRGT